jgi:hypothetical protein
VINHSDIPCSEASYNKLRAYSNRIGLPIRQVVDDMVRDWLQTVGRARLDSLSKVVGVSQNENSA